MADRFNHVANPAGAVSATPEWRIGSGTATLSRLTGLTGLERTTGLRATCGADGRYALNGRAYDLNGDQGNLQIAGSTTYTFSMTVRFSTPRSPRFQIQWYTSAGSYISASDLTFSTTANTWSRREIVAISPSTAGRAEIVINDYSGVSGDTMDATLAMVELGSAAGVSYFDGGSAGGSWLGATGQSQSQLSAVVPVQIPAADVVTEPVPPSLSKLVALSAADAVVEPVAPTVARVHSAPVADVVVEGLPVVASVRNTDLPAADVVTEPVPPSVARVSVAPVAEIAAEGIPVGVARAANPPVGETAVEGVAVSVARVVVLPVGEVVLEQPAVAVTKVIAVPAADVLMDMLAVTLSSVLAVGVIEVEGLPVTVAYGAEVSASRRGLPPVLFLPTTRVIAQSILSGKWLHWDLPVSDLEITWTLSGPQVISGKLEPEMLDLSDLGIEPWGTWLHVEDSGLIRASGILQPTTIDGESMSIEAVGPSAYASKIPYRGQYSQIDVDPAEIVRHLWSHIQSHPRGNLGVQVHGSTPVRLGTTPSEQVDFVTGGGEAVSFDRGGPYKLDFWENTLCGGEINELAGETPFDYVERAQWNADKTAVEHHIDLGYPRIGRRLTDVRFAQGENIIESAPIEEPDGVYADQVYVQGKGEGQTAITGYAGTSVGERLRLPVVVSDKTIASQDRARARASEELAARLAAMVEIAEIAVDAKHDNAVLGTFGPGDEVYPQLVLPYVGRFAAWHRILSVKYMPAREAAVLALSRRGEFADR